MSPAKKKKPSIERNRLFDIYERLTSADNDLATVQTALKLTRDVDAMQYFWIKQHLNLIRASLGLLTEGIERLANLPPVSADSVSPDSINLAKEYDLRSASFKLGVTEQTLRQWIKAGKLTAEHRGRGRGFYIVTGHELQRHTTHRTTVRYITE